MTVAMEWTLGDRIRKARKDAGLSQEELSEKLEARGIKAEASTISAWENDTRQPRRLMTVLKMIAEETGYPFPWLIGATGLGKQDFAWEPELPLDWSPVHGLLVQQIPA